MNVLSVVIVSYNTKDLTLRCLKSINSLYKKELENRKIEAIVVDNNSTDGTSLSIMELKEKVKGLILIQSKENLGFAKACNIGAKVSKGKYILFLNSDTEVEDRGFLLMAKYLEENPRIGILGGRLENVDATPQPSTGKFYNLFNLLIMLLGLERFGALRSSPTRIKRVDWVSGASMMVRREVFDKLSGFDEKIFMYMEDMELCFRADKMGFFTYYFPNIKLKHKSQGSSDRTFAIINIYKGILYFYSKHKSRFEYAIVKIFLVGKAEFLILLGVLTFNSDLSNRYRKALASNL